MAAVHGKLVTVISGEEVHSRIAEAVMRLGARGFTFSKVHGHGVHGTRPAGLFDVTNEAFTVVTSEAIAHKILEWVEHELIPHTPAIAYSLDAMMVTGPDKH